MHKLLATGALLMLALSGCSGGGDDDGGSPGAASSSASMTTTGPPPKPPVLSDTLHLLAAPDMALVLPLAGPEERTGTAGDFGPGGGGGQGQGPVAQWTYQMTGYSNVTTAEVRVWIEITDTLLQPPIGPGGPTQQQCTWSVQLALGADAEPHTGCLVEPPGPINAGTKELIFDLVGLDAELEANETVTFTFQRAAFSASPEDSVMVLSGTDEHDSRLVLAGLQEVVPE